MLSLASSGVPRLIFIFYQHNVGGGGGWLRYKGKEEEVMGMHRHDRVARPVNKEQQDNTHTHTGPMMSRSTVPRRPVHCKKMSFSEV